LALPRTAATIAATEGTRLAGYDQIIAAYDEAAEDLAERYDALPDGVVFADVRWLLPSGGLTLDVGAGSGRDARWLSAMGFDVVAVEPAAGLRAHGIAQGGGGVRWIDDRLPALDRVHRLALSYDLITLSAVWQHVAPEDRARAFRKLVTLLRPGGVLALTLRSGPAPSDRPMHPTSSGEVEALARAHGMEVLKVQSSHDLQGRAEVTWTTVALRLPDDGTGALPLVRGIVLGDDKSSTYKLGLLRAVARIAERSPGAAVPAAGHADAVEVPLGLVALFWIRMYLPLVRLGLPQAPRNSGPDGLGFAKAGFRKLLYGSTDPADLRVGAMFDEGRAAAVAAAIGEAASTIASMPANFTRFPNSDRRVFEATRSRHRRAGGHVIDLPMLSRWGSLLVPGHLWRALSRYGVWVEPMLVAEWARLSRSYAERIGLAVPPGAAEAALEWREPVRTTAVARVVAERMAGAGHELECVWTGRRLSNTRLDIDHCLPWSAWPCGDLWNLAPCDRKVNQHDKRDRLPSAAVLADSRGRMIVWWERGYLSDEALSARFLREVTASLPIVEGEGAPAIFAAVEWRRLRLLQDQRVPEWTR
jgi:SAM-dependent methyltransferase